jgi:hypothetical protein
MSGNELGDILYDVIVVYAIISVVGLWLATIIWVFRDMGARSRDGLARLLMAFVSALPLIGLVVYLFLRPRETLSEAYERSLEEEALLQEIEEKPSCPGCGQRVQDKWQVCPNCHTRLKKPCGICGGLLELPWKLCPYCASSQGSYATAPTPGPSQQAPMPVQQVSLTRNQPEPQSGYLDDLPEYVDDEDY